ncbi:hypothetical protein J1D01_07210 [Seonamhaeicola sp. NFXS20]|uniref:hypothetical protein n=1 Tax=Seonamhaeicola sp. NFXS20 TaxID=2816959 RepID=UPI003B8ABC79
MKKSLKFNILFLIVCFGINTFSALGFRNTHFLDSLKINKEKSTKTHKHSTALNFKNAIALTAINLEDVKAGEKVLYSKAIQYQNNYYDLVLTILNINGTYTVDCTNELRVSSFNSSNDDYVTYSFDLVETGSVTPKTPNGTPAVIKNVVLESRDIDTRSNRNFTEISGFNPYTVTSKITPYLSSTTNLEQAGFVNGPNPAGFTLYRLNPALAAPIDNWVSEPADVDVHGDDANFYLFMEFDKFSHVDLLYGATGTETSTWVRLINFGISTKSSIDDALALNTISSN